jgi:hypothetical protein
MRKKFKIISKKVLESVPKLKCALVIFLGTYGLIRVLLLCMSLAVSLFVSEFSQGIAWTILWEEQRCYHCT